MSAYPAIAGPGLEDDPALAELIKSLRERHNDAIAAVLLYGSCLRSGNIYAGLLDLYLLCDDYRSAYSPSLMAAANWLLPPNVFYADVEYEERTLRSKVTVISLEDFRRGCSRAWFQSYIWGRFAQPTKVLYSRDDAQREQVEECLLEAVHTLLHCSLPALPATGTLVELWEEALSLSYSTELRTERSSRPNELVSAAEEFYTQVSNYHADSLAFHFAVYDGADGARYRCEVPSKMRRSARIAWPARRIQGKLFSVMRLVKALFTFEGGLDYIAWKLERHSGEKIEIPEKVRRQPLIFMWAFFWKLYRRGIFK